MRTEQQIAKQYKLSQVMIETITYAPTTLVNADGTPKMDGIVYCDRRTEKALVARGLMHPTNSHLTTEGAAVVTEILAARQVKRDEVDAVVTEIKEKREADTKADLAYECSISNVMMDAVIAIGARSRSMSSIRSGTMAALIDRGLVTPKTPATGAMHLLTEKGAEVFQKLNGMVPQEKYIVQMAERDESAEFASCHPEPTPLKEIGFPVPSRSQPYMTLADHAAQRTDRDKMARTVAYEFAHIFVKWNVTEPAPENPVVPRELNMPRMLEFYKTGAMWSPTDLLTEIRNEMDSIIGNTDTTNRISRIDTVNAMMWLGWLAGYVMESGKLGEDGWQNRLRGPQEGWPKLGLYSTEPSDETELPAWADVDDADSYGCVAVISPQGRYSDAEQCSDRVTREEYYTNGSDGAMCAQHRLAAEMIDNQPY